MDVDDASLLREYVADRSDSAFADIVRRYGPIVYAAARRKVGQPQQAEDITQATFLILAQKASTIAADRSLAAWLLTTAHYVSRNAVRPRRRAMAHESAWRYNDRRTGGAADPVEASSSAEIESIIDAAISGLPEADRDVLVWRFYESHSLAEVGRRARISEEAARKRVGRAIERLREALHKRVTPSDLTSTLAALAVAPPMPDGLAASLPRVASQASPSTKSLATGGLALMTASKVSVVAVAVIALVLLAGAAVMVGLSGSKPRGSAALVTARSAQPVAADGPAGVVTPGEVEFADGTTARLAGVRSFYGSKPDDWWGVQGDRMPKPEVGDDDSFRNSLAGFEGPDRRAIEVRMAFGTYDRSSKGYTLRLGPDKSGASHTKWNGPDDVMFCGVYSLPRTLNEAELSVGLASGEWTDLETVSPSDAERQKTRVDQWLAENTPRPESQTPEAIRAATTAPTPSSPYRIHHITEKDGRTRVAWIDTRFWRGGQALDVQWRLMVRLRSGRLLRYKTVDYSNGFVFIYDTPLEEVEAAILQVREWEWQSMGMIPLRPKWEPATQPSTAPAATTQPRN